MRTPTAVGDPVGGRMVVKSDNVSCYIIGANMKHDFGFTALVV